MLFTDAVKSKMRLSITGYEESVKEFQNKNSGGIGIYDESAATNHMPLLPTKNPNDIHI
jgi:hypothetical protein